MKDIGTGQYRCRRAPRELQRGCFQGVATSYFPRLSCLARRHAIAAGLTARTDTVFRSATTAVPAGHDFFTAPYTCYKIALVLRILASRADVDALDS